MCFPTIEHMFVSVADQLLALPRRSSPSNMGLRGSVKAINPELMYPSSSRRPASDIDEKGDAHDVECDAADQRSAVAESPSASSAKHVSTPLSKGRLANTIDTPRVSTPRAFLEEECPDECKHDFCEDDDDNSRFVTKDVETPSQLPSDSDIGALKWCENASMLSCRTWVSVHVLCEYTVAKLNGFANFAARFS